MPAKHAAHSTAPSAAATVPEAHGVGAVAPSEHALPAVHGLHEFAELSPSSSPYDPAAHGLAVADPTSQ